MATSPQGPNDPHDPWSHVEGTMATVGVLAGEAERYRQIRTADGPRLLNESLALARLARDHHRHRPQNIREATELTKKLGDLVDEYRGVLERVRALVEQAIQAAGRIDILISNPAFGVRCGFLEYDPKEFQRVINSTLISGFHMRLS